MIAMFFTFIGAMFFLLMLGSGVLLLILLLAAVLGGRRRGPEAGSCRGPRWWPLLLATPLFLLLLFITNVGINTTKPTNEGAHARRMAVVQHALAQQQEEMTKRTQEVNAKIHHQIASMDIQELMDKADAPRIALPPNPPEAPDAGSTRDESAEEAEPAVVAEPAAESDESPVHDESAQPDAESDEAAGDDGEAESVVEAPGEATADHENAAGEEQVEPAVEANDQSAPAQTAEDAHREAGKELVESVNAPVSVLRPAWIDDAPKRVGNTWRRVIATDEFATTQECDREADRLLRRATFEHLQSLVGKFDDHIAPRIISVDITDEIASSDEDRSAAGHLNAMGITIDYIRREIARDEYLETVERSFGPMKKLYTLVEFTPAVDRDLRARWDDFRRQERFAAVSFGAASVLGLLGLAWGLLKVDTATKGYYSKRLFLGVPAAIIGGFLLLSIWFEYIF